jgi:hypothetical protein
MLLAAVLASLALATPARAALAPPELFVRLEAWDTHEPVGDWIPLASAPAFDYLGEYQIGYRLQASGQPHEFQRATLSIDRVPDGRPSQPQNEGPYCVGRIGTPGEIVDVSEVQFEGSGTDGVMVSIGLGKQDDDCHAASSSASFTITSRGSLLVAGPVVRTRTVPLPNDAFMGVRAPAPPGGLGDVRCALDGTAQPDGSVTGAKVLPDGEDPSSSIPETDFPRPGNWLCAGRGTIEGLDENIKSVVFGTPWSAPVTVPVLTDFRRYPATLAKPRSRHPVLRLRAEWAALSSGGAAKVTLRRVVGCKGRRFKLRKAGTFRGRFGAKRLDLRLRRPRKNGYYVAAFTFGGTQFVRASTEPYSLLMDVHSGFLEFSPASEFPGCP